MPIDPQTLVKTRQGANSKTWTPPPFYSGLTTPELFVFHAKNSPEHPVFAFDDEDGGLRTIKHREFLIGVRKAAKLISGYLSLPEARSHIQEGHDTSVIGILAVADSITYATLVVGTMYLGHTPFPISARNSHVAVAHLVRKTGVRQLLVSRDAAMQRAAHEAKETLAADGYEIELLPFPEFGEFYNDDVVPADIQMGPVSMDKNALILHSSGSTSFPKPIPISHRNFATWVYSYCCGDVDLCGLRISVHVLPFFHVMGCFTLGWVLGAGAILTVLRPTSPPTIVTPENAIRSVSAARCDGMICVPTFLESWSRDPDSVASLRSLKFIIFAGAPLSKEVGHLLVDQGVRIVIGYGLTETGALSLQVPDSTKILPKEWEYFSITPTVEYFRRHHEEQPELFELVILDSPLWSPNVFNTNVDGRPAYATSDYLQAHPTDPNLMRIFGRVDDQIILSTGEKTNPVPMEAILLQDPNIHAAIIFGRGRFQNGVIVQPRESFDPSDETKLEAFRQTIWPSVERANAFAPSHSRIFKEMITVTNPSKPFQYTAKGTPRRHVCIADYTEEIEELYKKVEESSQVDVDIPPAWTDESVRTYVRAVVQHVMKAPDLNDDADLFQQGCDSLQATWIRNSILHALRTTTKVSVHQFPVRFVYTNPSVSALGTFIARNLSGTSDEVDTAAERASQLAQMNALLDKYSADFPQPQWRTSTTSDISSRETILITGTTGRLGSHLLSQLLQDPEVVRVYALNRDSGSGSKKLEQKQKEAFKTWGLDEVLLSNGKVSFHVADLGSPSFSLGEATFIEMRNSITAIVHNAWRVDFQVSLPSFEPLIAGARNLLDFALSSSVPGGPRILFVSSIASMHAYASAGAIPESLDFGPEVAVGLGYGESKWVTEHIFARAANQTGLRATAVRVGQLSGDAHVGGWNTKEWVPALVRVSKKLQCVPARDATVSWVPVDTAASSLIEMLYSDASIYHITAPRPARWNDVFGPIAERLAVPLVPAKEWLDRLRESAQRAGAGPKADNHDSAHTLIDFFEATMSTEDVVFSTKQSVKAAESLEQLAPLGKADALRWLSFWESIGFMNV